MMNLWRKIKPWLVTEDIIVNDNIRAVIAETDQIASDALAHYCAICKRAWETKQGARMHKRLKHEGGKSNLPHLKIGTSDGNGSLDINSDLTSQQ